MEKGGHTASDGAYCLYEDGHTWSEAFSFCRDIGGKMAKTNTEKKNTEMASLINDVSV